MKCPECGNLIGHAPWCSLNPQSPRQTNEPFGKSLPDYDDDHLKGYQEPKLPSTKPLIPERDPLPRYNDEPSFLKRKFDSFAPAPEPDPLFKTLDPIRKDPLLSPVGTLRYADYSDAGVRFRPAGLITDHFGGTIGKLNGDGIFDLHGTQIGILRDDGKILNLDGTLKSVFLDKV